MARTKDRIRHNDHEGQPDQGSSSLPVGGARGFGLEGGRGTIFPQRLALLALVAYLGAFGNPRWSLGDHDIHCYYQVSLYIGRVLRRWETLPFSSVAFKSSASPLGAETHLSIDQTKTDRSSHCLRRLPSASPFSQLRLCLQLPLACRLGARCGHLPQDRRPSLADWNDWPSWCWPGRFWPC